MAIEVLPAQLYALAGVLDAAALHAGRVGTAADVDPGDGPLAEAVGGFCETTGTAARCLAGELSWLAAAVSASADSWLCLDGGLLPVAGRGVPT